MNPHTLLRPALAPLMPWARRLAPLLVFTALAPVALPQQTGEPEALDRVIAVVNDRAILQSDLTTETHLAVLEPRGDGDPAETPQAALRRLISRTLIRQQIRQEDAQAALPADDEVAARIAEIRKDLPVCVRDICTSEAGWNAFLSRNGLTQHQVENYVRDRIETLRFIEERFRQGIRISQDEIEAYYHDTLLPQYQPGQTVPPLDQVSPRIQEILLQRQVNTLFSGWLDNLRKQGQVEVLDPSLEAAADDIGGGAGSQ
jgi:hypothetical protein